MTFGGVNTENPNSLANSDSVLTSKQHAPKKRSSIFWVALQQSNLQGGPNLKEPLGRYLENQIPREGTGSLPGVMLVAREEAQISPK